MSGTPLMNLLHSFSISPSNLPSYPSLPPSLPRSFSTRARPTCGFPPKTAPSPARPRASTTTTTPRPTSKTALSSRFNMAVGQCRCVLVLPPSLRPSLPPSGYNAPSRTRPSPSPNATASKKCTMPSLMASPRETSSLRCQKTSWRTWGGWDC